MSENTPYLREGEKVQLSLLDTPPECQYGDRLRYILRYGTWKDETIQGVPQLVCLHLPPMVFDLAKCVPLITDRNIMFWKACVGEICAFINGARTKEELERFGCRFWAKWVTKEKCAIFGLKEGDLGPGSYGSAFARFPMPDGRTMDQWEWIVQQIQEKPFLATHEISPWIPYYTLNRMASDLPKRTVVVAPCHGWVHFEVLNGELHMTMRQRSADFPVGVPSNMIQYAAIQLAVAKITGYQPGLFIHQLCNAHIYQDQLPNVELMLEREPRPLPTFKLTDNFPQQISEVRAEHFVLENYDPHPAIKNIPVAI